MTLERRCMDVCYKVNTLKQRPSNVVDTITKVFPANTRRQNKFDKQSQHNRGRSLGLVFNFISLAYTRQLFCIAPHSVLFVYRGAMLVKEVAPSICISMHKRSKKHMPNPVRSFCWHLECSVPT